MNRVKIKFPDENPLFNTSIPIRISDINYGNHVGNDAILSIIHEARLQFLSSYGLTELDAGGAGLIMADVMIAYRGEGFYGDTLKVEIYAVDVTSMSFSLLYKLSTDRNSTPIDIAHAKTGLVCFNYDERRVVPVTESLKRVLKDV